jgi:hypothetical protein
LESSGQGSQSFLVGTIKPNVNTTSNNKTTTTTKIKLNIILANIFFKRLIKMPFKSQAQYRKCRILEKQAKRDGKKPAWNCDEWLAETKKPIRQLPTVAKTTQKTKAELYQLAQQRGIPGRSKMNKAELLRELYA